MTTRVPEEIQHLDFDPSVTADATPTPDEDELHECDIKGCTRVADWVGRMGCCKYTFHACNQCKQVVARVGATCRTDRCGKSREARWVTSWNRL